MRADKAPVFHDLRELELHLRSRRTERLVLANGCFDPLHVGHVRYLSAAAGYGDFLLVAVNDDGSTRRLKGRGRPFMSGKDRADLISSLAVVDAVLLFDEDDVAHILERLRPAFHAKGTDYTEQTVPEREIAARVGARVVIVGDSKERSSSGILDRVRRAKR